MQWKPFPKVTCLDVIRQVAPGIVPLLKPISMDRELPQGVSFIARENKFCASCQTGTGRPKVVGYRKTVVETHDLYLNYRAEVLNEYATILFNEQKINERIHNELRILAEYFATYPRTEIRKSVVKRIKPALLLFGVGLNDMESMGHRKAYHVWRQMLARCYSTHVQKKQPTYIGCKVHPSWHSFSNFHKWYIDNYIESYQLDKDILETGNTIYGPDTCCFVPQEINKLFTARNACRGNTAQGVSFNKYCGYDACYTRYGRSYFIGAFKTECEAFKAYQESKRDYILEIATEYFKSGKIEEKVANALCRRARNFEF